MSKITIAENLDRLAMQYQAVIDASAALKEIGKLEQVAAEAKKAADAAAENAKIAQEELAAVKADIKKAKAKGEDIIGAAVISSHEKLEAADLEAKAVLVAANEQAGDIIAKARKDADAICSGVEIRRTALAKDVDALNERAALMEKVIADKTSAVADLELRLAKAQAQITKLLG